MNRLYTIDELVNEIKDRMWIMEAGVKQKAANLIEILEQKNLNQISDTEHKFLFETIASYPKQNHLLTSFGITELVDKITN